MVIALGVQERPVGPVSKNMVESARRRQPLLTSSFCAQAHVCTHRHPRTYTQRSVVLWF